MKPPTPTTFTLKTGTIIMSDFVSDFVAIVLGIVVLTPIVSGVWLIHQAAEKSNPTAYWIREWVFYPIGAVFFYLTMGMILIVGPLLVAYLLIKDILSFF